MGGQSDNNLVITSLVCIFCERAVMGREMEEMEWEMGRRERVAEVALEGVGRTKREMAERCEKRVRAEREESERVLRRAEEMIMGEEGEAGQRVAYLQEQLILWAMPEDMRDGWEEAGRRSDGELEREFESRFGVGEGRCLAVVMERMEEIWYGGRGRWQ